MRLPPVSAATTQSPAASSHLSLCILLPVRAAVWAAYFEENTLPACSDGKNFTYKHWDETLPDSVAMAPGPNNTEPGTGINGHEDGTYLWDEVGALEYIGHAVFGCQGLSPASLTGV